MAEQLAQDLRVVDGQLRFEKPVFDSWRKRIEVLGKADREALAADCMTLLVRLRALQQPPTAVAMLQLLLLNRELSSGRHAWAGRTSTKKSRP